MEIEIYDLCDKLNKTIKESEIYKNYLKQKEYVDVILKDELLNFNELRKEFSILNEYDSQYKEIKQRLIDIKTLLDNNIEYKKYIEYKNKYDKFVRDIFNELFKDFPNKIKIRSEITF